MSRIDNILRLPACLRISTACAAFLLLLALALCGCGGGSRTPTPINYTGDGTSGLRGVVTGLVDTTGATIPPLANVDVVVSIYTTIPSSKSVSPLYGDQKGGAIVARTRSDAQGNYSVPLIPGDYAVSVSYTSPTPIVGGSVMGGAGGNVATVTAHQFTPFNLVVYF